MTPNGTRAIETLRPGDQVISFNTQTKTKEIAFVKKQHVHDSNEYYVINDSLKVTGEHPFGVLENGVITWKRTKELKKGDVLLSDVMATILVAHIQKVQTAQTVPVYNPEISYNNTYFVKMNDVFVLVHNKPYIAPKAFKVPFFE